MAQGQVTITLPISAHALGAIEVFALAILLTVLVFVFTRRKEGKDWVTQLQEKAGLSGLHPIPVAFVALVWIALFSALLAGIFWVLYGVLERSVAVTPEEGKILRWYLLTLAAITAALGAVISFPFTLIRMQLNRRQTETAEQGHITDRINTAVAGLGAEKTIRQQRKDKKGNLTYGKVNGKTDYSQPVMIELTAPNLEVRIGAIYALERIAQDSDRDHVQIIEILCAYVRENARATDLEPSEGLKKRPKPRSDIQTAITVIGRRPDHGKSIEAKQEFRLDLRYSNLSGADFRNYDFSAAMFYYCKLEAALFRETKLHGTNFLGSLLNHIDFFKADMRGTRLEMVTINRPLPNAGGMNETINMANYYGITLGGADISAVDYLGTKEEMMLTFGTKDTKLSEEMEEDRREVNIHKFKADIRKAERSDNKELADELQRKFRDTGFSNWVHYNLSDLATGHDIDTFFNELGLTDFPFHGVSK